ncbi:GNAT family N-acetyltransferase [Streptodolium elevatio]|uniref:GNAT family N-acetyltransferase n=1 Tax=Streptodolium elevatio TaxID=3157996 RepID=A0ABV3DLH2_9ACTN
MTKKQNRRRTRPRAIPKQRTARVALGPWPGPAETRIRAAAPGEVPAIDALLHAAGTHLEAHDALDAGQFGALVRTGLLDGTDAMFAEVEAAVRAWDLDRLIHGMTTVLVAEDEAGDVVGAVVMLPPGQVCGPLAERGVWGQVLRLILTTTKLRGIAVAEAARGRGIGTALLDQAVSLHQHLGAALVYGQFTAQDDLEAYYRTRGFDVLAPGAGFSLNPLGVGVTVNAYPHERLITRWML